MQAVGEATHTTPTGKETLIDWALVSQVTQLKQCEVIPPIANSDHNGLMLQWAWKQPGNRNKTKPRQIWRYTHGDFERANNILSSVDWDQLIDPTDVNQSLLNWEQYFMNVMGILYTEGCASQEEKCSLAFKEHASCNAEEEQYVQTSQVVWVPTALKQV